jgi:pimeloyl-ACP methyl ester carboxylesterase
MYWVQTKDDYVLKIYRIQAKNTKMQQGLPVAFLQHGLLDSSDDWIINDEALAIGLILANEYNFDVWIGNNRGNKYSANHTTLNPKKDKKFWEFSFQEMGEYDLPAIYDFIQNKTNCSKLSYIAHSQGTSQMFAALASKDESIAARTKEFHALAPVAFFNNQKSPLIYAMIETPAVQLLNFLHIWDFLPADFMLSYLWTSVVCEVIPKICFDILSIFVGESGGVYDNEARYDIFLDHIPAGSSLQSLQHYKQLAIQETPAFQKFNWGMDGNMEHYGQPYPPDWDLGNIDVPVYMYVGIDDDLGDTLDNEHLKTQLKTLQFYKEYPLFDHSTFLWGGPNLQYMAFLEDLFTNLKSNM